MVDIKLPDEFLCVFLVGTTRTLYKKFSKDKIIDKFIEEFNITKETSRENISSFVSILEEDFFQNTKNDFEKHMPKEAIECTRSAFRKALFMAISERVQKKEL